MNPPIFYIEGKKYIPEVRFDSTKGLLTFSGQCYHEYTEEFFAPIYKWVNEYLKEPARKITLEFKMNYYNTVCSRCFLEFLEMFEDYALNQGGQVTVNWYYKSNDYDMQESGEDYQDDLELDINLISH